MKVRNRFTQKLEFCCQSCGIRACCLGDNGDMLEMCRLCKIEQGVIHNDI